MSKRYLSSYLQNDLATKMVLLAGPRQCGKTTLSKALLGSGDTYLNWDIQKNRKIIREVSWPKDCQLVVLDEIHKMPKWKNYLKGVADEFKNRPSILVTGSARLDAFRNAGDALTGRQYLYRLHPIDVAESKLFLPKLAGRERMDRLIQTGGFPESFLNPNDAERLRRDRFDTVTKEDVRDLSRVTAWRGVADLIELLRERVGKPIQYDSLSGDLGVSAPTVKSWVELLEKLYIIYRINPYSKNISSSIRKEKRVYFYDCGSAYDDTLGAKIENLVGNSLLKWIQLRIDSKGENWGLSYLKDKQKHDVDFVVTKNNKIEYLIEVKKSESKVASGLRYFQEKLKIKNAIQLVYDSNQRLEKDGVRIEPLGPWLENLDFK